MGSSSMPTGAPSSSAMLARKAGSVAAAVMSWAVAPPSACTMVTRTVLSPRSSRAICSAVTVTGGSPLAKDLILAASTAFRSMAASARRRRVAPI